jgi:hypothetical protein
LIRSAPNRSENDRAVEHFGRLAQPSLPRPCPPGMLGA